MLLHIKTSKVCARTEGVVGIRIFVFLSGKLSYFFLGLCLFVFCSSCGGECPSTANFCHRCGQQLNLSQVWNKAAIKFGWQGKTVKGVFPSEISLLSHRYFAGKTINAPQAFKKLFATAVTCAHNHWWHSNKERNLLCPHSYLCTLKSMTKTLQ